jgi:hypothetical protein
MRTSFPHFRDPSALTVRERRAEIVEILSRGVGRYLSDLPALPKSDLGTCVESAESSLNQLDAGAHQSVYAGDENT